MKVKFKKVKIFVTIPTYYVDKVRKAVCQAGAGIIGNYTCCTTSVKGIGTFKPNESANPYIGKKNHLQFVEEVKLEFVCDIEKVGQVIKELRHAHPYEEPAIDIFPLLDEKCFVRGKQKPKLN